MSKNIDVNTEQKPTPILRPAASITQAVHADVTLLYSEE